MKDFTGIPEASSNVIRGQVRITVEDLRITPALRKKIEYQFDRNARAPNHRFADKHLRVDDNPLG